MTTRLGDMIRAARKRAGLRLEDVAGQVGVTTGALSHIESGRRLPQPQNAVLIAEVLGIPSEELLLALDDEHSARRRGSVDTWRSGAKSAKPSDMFQMMPVEALFDGARAKTPKARPAQSHAAYPASTTPREMARWSDVTAERIHALDHLATAAAEAIRTLKGLLGDDDPAVAREAARLLRELDVSGFEE